MSSEDLFESIFRSGRSKSSSIRASLDDAHIIQTILGASTRALQQRNEDGLTPLHTAIEWGFNDSIIKSLIEAYPQAASISDRKGNTPLHKATAYDDFIIKVLIEACPQAASISDKRGNTPLHIATADDEDDTSVKVLIEACPQAARVADIEGNIPLHSAIKGPQSMKKIPHLLLVHPYATRTFNDYGITPVRSFFSKWNIIVRETLNSIKDNAHLTNVEFDNCLWDYEEYVKIGELHETALLFLRAFTHGTIQEEFIRFLPLHAAIITSDCPWSFFSMILRLKPELVYQQDVHGNLPLHVAAATKSSFDGEIQQCINGCGTMDDSLWYEEDRDLICKKCMDNYDMTPKEIADGYNLMRSVNKIPSIIADLLAADPGFASLPNHHGSLPLMIALENQKYCKEEGVQAIFKASPRALSTRDKMSHLYPFMMPAVSRSKNKKRKKVKLSDEYLGKFTCCFSLLMENPVLVKTGNL